MNATTGLIVSWASDSDGGVESCRTQVLFSGSQLESQEKADHFVVSILQFAERRRTATPLDSGGPLRTAADARAVRGKSSVMGRGELYLSAAPPVCER